MKVSAVGFLFQNQIKNKFLPANNYTCVIHKQNPLGGYNRNIITSPIIKESTLEHITEESAESDILKNLSSITQNKNKSKFIGATVKDGIKETEIHSLFSDKLFAIRTKDEFGKNHFKILGQKATQKTLSKSLDINI